MMMMMMMMMMMISHFNSTSTPKGSYRAKTGDNDCNVTVNSSRYSLRTALCESICYQAKSEQNVQQDLIPRVHHGEAALMHPSAMLNCDTILSNGIHLKPDLTERLYNFQ